MARSFQLSAVLLAAVRLLWLPAVLGQDASILTSEVGRLNNQSLLWGPYKPNVYFGVRPRIPKSLWAGLMWVKVDNYEDLNSGTRQA
jgi:mannosyl-oligosaccharide glucosidase